ncbi:hypothetical protein FRC07_012595 [Ceratobasidium sp. 392]|nr:hypothetical protein FRC07_012595 [Ceratobasidium sp. 392]
MSTAPTLLFDFVPVLTSLDPHHTYATTPLLDALFDVTSRITISPSTNSEEHICLFGQGTSSIIAKYAPPYVADIGEGAPFSQLRQTYNSIPGAREFLREIVVQAVRYNLLTCGIDPTEADALAELAMEMFVRQGEADDKVFSMGDCQPKSLLVLAEDGLAVTDWEFAGMNAPLEDVGQLTADLYLLYQTSPPESQPAIQTFTLAFNQTHHAQAPKHWYKFQYRVGAWRVFGLEMVNNIVETDWFDGDEVRRDTEMKRLGKKGAEFMRDAEHKAKAEASAGTSLFEAVFAEQQCPVSLSLIFLRCSPSFDFVSILTSLDPHHNYTQTPLSGGIVNITSRITISPNVNFEEHECPFGQGVDSVVAKYAPPYVATIGESAPFSQSRQVIEAHALHLLSQPSTHAYIHNNLSHNVSTPVLLHHDPSAHVLIMSDLGHDSFTLDHWLVSVSCPSIEAATAAGTRFGSFFARLGGLKDAIPNLQLDFTNLGARELVMEVYVRGVRGDLAKCGIDSAEAKVLTDSAVETFVRQCETDDKVFSLGDCWTKSLLVLAGEGLAVIDWEFAGMNAPLEDVSQLAACLYIFHQTSPSESQPAIKAFALAFYRTYHAQAPDRWYETEHRVNAWGLFGRVIVNSIVEADWFDGDEMKREDGMKRLGKKGAEFMRDAEQKAKEEVSAGTSLFETVFAELQ